VPDAGYGGRFLIWVLGDSRLPYGSYGNGSAMRVSPVAWYADTLEETLGLAAASAEGTHDHPEGVKGAVAVAGAIFLARVGESKDAIRAFLSRYYALDFTLDDIREEYDFDETCQGSVPQALTAFLEGESFEDVIRAAVSVGGDSDTIAAMAGSIAEAYYGIPEDLAKTALSYLELPLLTVTKDFTQRFVAPKQTK
ncbi:MAG: ADP-ribosylglycohydrolase family protein, partial [Clostridia bacterium]|nr:ADP-ribosylglycohydrolase family protein [Clostridia bacterium]